MAMVDREKEFVRYQSILREPRNKLLCEMFRSFKVSLPY